ncbi:hypothetical protein [Nostoc sp. FACHB-280]|uniref:hypothetical protein n=1 Tax=Nostoc sp. FACHB-280 TaxID=2692839 RepID=UPI00168B7765|nr:hypothetical protein [Nostoc sp. FACHB-280]MBD2495073.1 hypothetical protein [Nostoc sp. FACHB-280]
MSRQMIVSDLWFELILQQQELVMGGVDLQTNDSNFDQSFTKNTMGKTNQNQTNVTNSYTQRNYCQNNAASSLSINPLDNADVATPVSSSVVLP